MLQDSYFRFFCCPTACVVGRLLESLLVSWLPDTTTEQLSKIPSASLSVNLGVFFVTCLSVSIKYQIGSNLTAVSDRVKSYSRVR